VATFEELTGETELAAKLRAIYTNVNRVDLLVGLFAEWRPPEAVLGTLMSIMVGSDAFSQALTNPLLSEEVQKANPFSDVGKEAFENTHTLADLVRRNTKIGDRKVSFRAPRPIPGSYGPWLIGTLLHSVDFYSGWLGYFRKRQARFSSNLFRTNIIGTPAIAVTDHNAIAPLFESKDFKQDYGFGWAIPDRGLAGNVTPSLFESGEAHDVPKKLYMNLLRAGTATLSPTFDAVANEFIELWVGKKRFRFADDAGLRRVVPVRMGAGQAFRHGRSARSLQGFQPRRYRMGREIHPILPYRRRLAIYGRLLAFVKTAP
jgi:hypothetical protein